MSVKMALLSLVAGEPRYGYQLRADFEERTGGAWPLNVGQVYTTLARLSRDGLVVIDGTSDGDDTRTYAASTEGRAAVAGWFATPVARGEAPPREELAIKIAVAVQAPGVDVRDVIQRQRSETLRALQTLTRAKAGLQDDLTGTLLIESQIFAVEAEARWLDVAEDLVGRRPGHPSQRDASQRDTGQRDATPRDASQRDASPADADFGDASPAAASPATNPVPARRRRLSRSRS